MPADFPIYYVPVTGATNYIIDLKGTGSFLIQDDGVTKLSWAPGGGLDIDDWGITSAGDISGVANLDGTGDITMATITMTGFSVGAAGATTVASLDASNGGISNAGALSGVTTYSGTGILTVLRSGIGIRIDRESADTSPPTLELRKSHGAGVNAAVNDYCGEIDLQFLDADTPQAFLDGARVSARVTDMTVDAEKCELLFSVRNGTGITEAGRFHDDLHLELKAGLDMAGAVTGATDIDATGDLTAGTITMTGFSVGAAGAVTAASLDNSNGGITNAGAISGATTITNSTIHYINETSSVNLPMTVGVVINQGGADNNSVILKSTDVSQPFTDYVGVDEGDTYLDVLKYHATGGGCTIRGFSGGDYTGLFLLGYMGATDPTDTMGAVTIRGGKSNGGSGAVVLGDDETILSVENFGTSKFRILGDGHTIIEGSLQGDYEALSLYNNHGHVDADVYMNFLHNSAGDADHEGSRITSEIIDRTSAHEDCELVFHVSVDGALTEAMRIHDDLHVEFASNILLNPGADSYIYGGDAIGDTLHLYNSSNAGSNCFIYLEGQGDIFNHSDRNIYEKLGDAAGADQWNVRDSNNVTVAYIDSDGNYHFAGASESPIQLTKPRLNSKTYVDDDGFIRWKSTEGKHVKDEKAYTNLNTLLSELIVRIEELENN